MENFSMKLNLIFVAAKCSVPVQNCKFFCLTLCSMNAEGALRIIKFSLIKLLFPNVLVCPSVQHNKQQSKPTSPTYTLHLVSLF